MKFVKLHLHFHPQSSVRKDGLDERREEEVERRRELLRPVGLLRELLRQRREAARVREDHAALHPVEDGAQGLQAYVFSNLYSNFWLILGKL